MNFLIASIPLWVISFLFLGFGWRIGIFSFVIEGAFFYFALLHGKKQNRAISFWKIGLIMAVYQIASTAMLIGDPMLWPQQWARDVDPSLVITPNDEYVQELKSRFDSWLASSPSINGSDTVKFSTYYDDGLRTYEYYYWEYITLENISIAMLDEVTFSAVADWFIQKYIVIWTSDMEVYGVQDYYATPHEVLQQCVDNGWSAPAHDDCDGIAVVTVSLLKSYGIQAYLGRGRGHMFTVVLPSNSTMEKYGLQNPILINYWSTVHVWVYFDDDEFYYPIPITQTIADLYLMDNEEAFQKFFDLATEWSWIIIPLSIIVSIIAILFLGYPRNYPNLEEEGNRKARREKVTAHQPLLMKRGNPLGWVVSFTYVRVGNPFRKVYKNEWLNVLMGTVLVLIPVYWLLANQDLLTQYTLVIFNLYLFLAVMAIDRDIFVRLKETIKLLTIKKEAIKPALTNSDLAK